MDHTIEWIENFTKIFLDAIQTGVVSLAHEFWRQVDPGHGEGNVTPLQYSA